MPISSLRHPIILAVILLIFVIAPLFYPGYFQVHTGFVPLWNVVDLRANLGQLTWMPHLAIDFNPLRTAGLLPYYLAALLPLSAFTAVKVVLGLSWLLGSLGMFLWLKSWLGEPGALVAALVYSYLPHHLATVYVRGAWGEALFWGLLPAVLLMTTYLVSQPQWYLVPLAAGGWLMLGLSHLGLSLWALIFTIFLVSLIHFSQAGRPIMAALSGTLLTIGCYLSLGVSIIDQATQQTTQMVAHLLYPFQPFSAYWGFGASRPGWDDGLAFQIGLAAIGLTIVSLMVWQRPPGANSPASRFDRRLLFFVSATLIFLGLQLTPWLWQIPLLGHYLSQTLAYPWQLMGFVGLSLAVLAGVAWWLDDRLAQLPYLAGVVIFIILSSYPYLEPQFISADEIVRQPAGIYGDNQILLLEPQFGVQINGHTAGLERDLTTIPLVVHGPAQANDILQLQVTWQPLQPLDRNWKLFVHLVGANHQVVAQFDGYPQKGTYPTTAWQPGERIVETYPLFLPNDFQPGDYQVYIGFYDETTFARLPVSTDSNGRVILTVE